MPKPTLEALPAELLAAVAAGLTTIEDALACAQVSKALRARWTEPIVATALCKAIFPGVPRPHTLAAFRAASRRYLRRRAGLHTSFSHHLLEYGTEGSFSLDEAVHPDGMPPVPMPDDEQPLVHDYRESVIVWSIGRSTLVVDDLHAKKRRVLDITSWGFEGTLATAIIQRFGNAQYGRMVWVGGPLVVVRPMRRPTQL